eukprot:3940971-Rhodomonas_salina.1
MQQLWLSFCRSTLPLRPELRQLVDVRCPSALQVPSSGSLSGQPCQDRCHLSPLLCHRPVGLACQGIHDVPAAEQDDQLHLGELHHVRDRASQFGGI